MEEKKSLEVYYTKLNEALNTPEACFIFNRDRAHNSTIMRFMFDKSNEVFMFCGSMSVFRDGFYKKIEFDEKIEEGGLKISKDAKSNLSSSLKSFFAKEDSKLTIILERYDSSFFDDLIDIDLFKENVNKGRLLLYKLDDNFTFKKKLSHFASSDKKIVRLEQDKEEHSAVCIINDEKMLDSSRSMFNKLVKVATRVEWPKQN